MLVAELLFGIRVKVFQSAGDTELASVGLPIRTTTRDGDDHINNVLFLGQGQGSQNHGAKLVGPEELGELTVVDTDLAIARTHANTRHRGLAAAGSELVVLSIPFQDIVATLDHEIFSAFLLAFEFLF